MHMIWHDDVANEFESAVAPCLSQTIDEQLTSIFTAKDRNSFERYGGYVVEGIRLI